jgi:hypothetical protein
MQAEGSSPARGSISSVSANAAIDGAVEGKIGGLARNRERLLEKLPTRKESRPMAIGREAGPRMTEKTILVAGLSPDATVAAARALIDDAIEQAVISTETLIRDFGGTPEEIEAECAITFAECIASRDAYLLQLRRWIDEPAAPPPMEDDLHPAPATGAKP